MTEFGLSLFRRTAPPEANYFYSPVSTAVALAMTYDGARGGTATQMAAALGSTVTPDVFASSMNRLLLDLSSRNIAPASDAGGSKSLALHPANGVWVQEGANLLPGYLETMSVRYDAAVKVLDLQGGPAAATRTINQWAADKTRDKIRDLIPDGSIDEETALVLTNALYFYGSWHSQFNPQSTQPGGFHAPSGDVAAQMMTNLVSVSYGEGADYQIIDLPYFGGKVAMTMLLPAAGKLAATRDGLTASRFAEIRSTMSSKLVRLQLPKFRFEYGTQKLNEPLIAMGMVDAFFAEPANFDGLFGGAPRVFIKDVWHKAFIGIDEAGTEAAAATAVVLRDAGGAPTSPERDFTADRPFLIFIRDDSGALLFAGQVTEPTR
jgi:serpin B